jgi:Tol biopolymer transport system component
VIWLRGSNRREDFAPVALISLSGRTDAAAFSPDGNRVAFPYLRADADNKSGIYVKQVGGGPPVRLTTDESDLEPAWSPDDRSIAFLRGAGPVKSVMLIPAIGGGTPRELAKLDAPLCRMSWTPDSRWLLVSVRESPDEPYGLWLLSAETGERRRLLPRLSVLPTTTTWNFGDFSPSLSPDGRVLVFSRSVVTWQLNLFKVRLTPDLRPEGPPEKLTDRNYTCIGEISWPSEGEIVFSGDSTLFRMQVSAGSTPERLNWAARPSDAPAVSRSKHRLVYNHTLFTDDFVRLDLRTGHYQKIVESSYSEQHPQYSPDGRRIAFDSNRSGQSGLWTCGTDDESCQELTSYERGTGGTPRWSPDGQWIAFDSRREGPSQIYVIASGGGAPRRLTSGSAEQMIPSWSRDGRWIYFASNRDGKWRVWKAPAAGGDAVEVTHSHGGAAFESVDGKNLYFFSEDTKALYRMPVGGGEEKQVVPYLSGWERFAVTANGVYFFPDSQTLQLLDEKTGLIRTVAKLEGHSLYFGMTISPDSEHLVFSEETILHEDVMLVEGFR